MMLSQCTCAIKKCMRCSAINGATDKFCGTCSLPLDEKVANEILNKDQQRQEADGIMEGLMKDPEVIELFKKKIGLIS